MLEKETKMKILILSYVEHKRWVFEEYPGHSTILEMWMGKGLLSCSKNDKKKSTKKVICVQYSKFSVAIQ